MNLIPYSVFTLRTYIAQLWKKRPFLREFLDEPDTPLDIRVPLPRARVYNVVIQDQTDNLPVHHWYTMAYV